MTMCCWGRFSMERTKVRPTAAISSLSWGEGHFVKLLDGDGGILFAVFDEDDAAAGLERLADFGHDFIGEGELVIDIDEEDEVEGGGGEMRIGFCGLDHLDIGGVGGGGTGAESGEHRGLNVDGEDFAGGADERRYAEGEVA